MTPATAFSAQNSSTHLIHLDTSLVSSAIDEAALISSIASKATLHPVILGAVSKVTLYPAILSEVSKVNGGQKSICDNKILRSFRYDLY